MRVALIGYGRMGKMVAECMGEREGMEIAGIVDFTCLPSLRDVSSPDVAIDFSYPGDLDDLLDAATVRRVPLVIGRTALTAEQEAKIAAAAKAVPIVSSNNFSLGVTVMRRLVAEAAAALGVAFDVEIVEAHHKQKLDAPSGTVKLLLTALDPSGNRPVLYGREGVTEKRGGEIGVHALRGGTVCGEHSVHFYGDMEELSVTHRADSRRIFAAGALRAAEFVVKQAPGLYTMEQVLFATRAG
ncbi:MAG: 4-hydroxy-tetrahydrodipicolinate reductase [Firmicutes bacterium]|nr:4-hydroxy-tetrahydrodipicolinate reductase [Bacillota bacterium]